MSVLEGIRIVELAHERVSWAGKLLGDMGADVISVSYTHLTLPTNREV